MKKSICILVAVILMATFMCNACTLGKTDSQSGDSQNGGSVSVSDSAGDGSCESSPDGEKESDGYSESLSESDKQDESNDYSESMSDSEKIIEPTDLRWFQFTILDDNNSYAVAKCSDYNEDIYPTEIVIPSVYNDKPVTVIGEEAFYGCRNLTSVTIPNSISRISERAFDNCNDKLYTKIDQIIYVDKWVVGIDDFNAISTVNIMDGTRGIAAAVFSECWTLISITIPDSIKRIDDHVFLNCTKLTDVFWDNGITSIGWYAFCGCASLQKFSMPESLEVIDEFAFAGCDAFTSIYIPNSVRSIGEGAFVDCKNVEKIEVGADNEIYYSTNNCVIEKKTKTITVGCKNSVIPTDEEVDVIGERAFSACDGLTNMTIPNNITVIGANAFSWCDNLVSVVIPDSVIFIGEDAFFKCINLTSLTIPESVKTIVDGAFAGCKKLKEIEVDLQNNVYYSVDNCIIKKATNELVVGCKESLIPSDGKVTRIGAYSFFWCYDLTSVVVPSSIERIGTYAFGMCEQLTSVTFEGTVEQWNAISISDSAFINTKVLIVKCSDGDVKLR